MSWRIKTTLLILLITLLIIEIKQNIQNQHGLSHMIMEFCAAWDAVVLAAAMQTPGSPGPDSAVDGNCTFKNAQTGIRIANRATGIFQCQP